MSRGYAWEKFYTAARTRATSTSSLQERVASAFVYNLIHAAQNGLPSGIAAKYAKYEQQWGQNAIGTWAKRLADDEAAEVAGWIFETFIKLDRQDED
jgi:hypothetical protein